jgi:hypothetical protein
MGSVDLVDSDEHIERCFAVMVQLRPHLEPEAFVETVRRHRAGGYQLASLEEDGIIYDVAGDEIFGYAVTGPLFAPQLANGKPEDPLR